MVAYILKNYQHARLGKKTYYPSRYQSQDKLKGPAFGKVPEQLREIGHPQHLPHQGIAISSAWRKRIWTVHQHAEANLVPTCAHEKGIRHDERRDMAVKPIGEDDFCLIGVGPHDSWLGQVL